MRLRILFLTNRHNGAPKEDDMVVDFLRKDFDLRVSHPLDCVPLLNKVDGVIIRNIWPTHEYSGQWSEVESRLRESGLPTYNPLSGKGDARGKDYLLELFQEGFPVIPSVDDISDLNVLGTPQYYWIKPKHGCDGWGAGRFAKEQLNKISLNDHIIQPFVEFSAEPSFFFVDNRFSHAISTPNRLKDAPISQFDPTADDIEFAEAFVKWNTLPHGVQRVDAVRANTGELLLTEVEDLCPYLYFADVAASQRQEFLRKIRNSLFEALSMEKPISDLTQVGNEGSRDDLSLLAR